MVSFSSTTKALLTASDSLCKAHRARATAGYCFRLELLPLPGGGCGTVQHDLSAVCGVYLHAVQTLHDAVVDVFARLVSGNCEKSFHPFGFKAAVRTGYCAPQHNPCERTNGHSERCVRSHAPNPTPLPNHSPTVKPQSTRGTKFPQPSPRVPAGGRGRPARRAFPSWLMSTGPPSSSIVDLNRCRPFDVSVVHRSGRRCRSGCNRRRYFECWRPKRKWGDSNLASWWCGKAGLARLWH